MSNKRPTTLQRTVYYNNRAWLLNTYVIRNNEKETISEQEVKNLIEKLILELESACFSDEFDYLKTGFAFLHYGNRGVNLSIWHFGKWGDTYELYNSSWYCYGRNTKEMELLDSAEPVLSQYELKLFLEELHICSELLEKINSPEQFKEMYIDKWTRNEVCYML